ncbi:hypothetical protein GCM10027046_13910 [Uliginosibacterium flavum]|uniref:Exosortase-associated protein EpsI, B-type n=1 Tax=Uliginosibacterium flavum TaxID=1396831 RepID=A0ABV2TQT1_9RHOO
MNAQQLGAKHSSPQSPVPSPGVLIRQSIAAFVLMLAAALTAWALVPTHKLVDQWGKLDLETSIPKEFGDWVMDTRSYGGVVNPQQAEALNKIYSQTLSRTYINRRTGEYVMLSIAYGEDQRDGMQLHYPEICYPAQGFQLKSRNKGVLSLPQGLIPIRRLETYAGQRFEPVTYWTMIGEHATLGGTDKKLLEMRYSLAGDIPDGLLFRVSSINRDSAAGFALQDAFLSAIVAHIAPETRPRFAGIH